MEEIRNLEKKIKGYGYDSLCFRYKIAREAQAKYEAENSCSHQTLERAMDLAKRDELRFFQILDDLIGEHD